jgi:hypothetical protein
MALEQDTVRLVKAALRNDGNSDVRKLREEWLDRRFGGTEWLADDNTRFQDDFDSLSGTEIDQLAALARDATDDNGVRLLVQWFEELLKRQATPATRPSAPVGPRFTDVARVPDHPDWWMGFDTAETRPADQWKYVLGTAKPTDDTTGWTNQAAAFAAMVAPSVPVYTNISGVAGYPGWWMGFDAAQRDPAEQWRYVRSTDTPTAGTTGWQDQATAFAAMRGDTVQKAAPALVMVVPDVDFVDLDPSDDDELSD